MCELDIIVISEEKNLRKLESTKKLFNKWKVFLCSEHKEQSVFHQICHMLWSHAWYRTLNHCVLIANKEKRIINGGLWDFLKYSYVDTQTLAIRKLTDMDEKTVSLKRLVCDFAKHAKEISREAYLFSHNSLVNTENIDIWQSQFDELSGTKDKTRSSTDTISAQLLNFLNVEIDTSCKSVRTYVDKCVAHADKKGMRRKKFKLSFSVIEKAQKTICQVYSFCGTNLYGHGIGGLIPVPQYPLFKGLENAFIVDGHEEGIGRFWDEHNKKTNQWSEYNSLIQRISIRAEL